MVVRGGEIVGLTTARTTTAIIDCVFGAVIRTVALGTWSREDDSGRPVDTRQQD